MVLIDGADGFDRELIELLRERRVPATSRRWGVARSRPAAALARDPLFEVGNHETNADFGATASAATLESQVRGMPPAASRSCAERPPGGA